MSTKQKDSGTVPAKAGMDHKGQSASYMRSQAVRTGSESVIGPEPDREAQLGNERSSTLSPDDRARANREAASAGKKGAGTRKQVATAQPMGDEVPVSGIDDTPRGRLRPDGDPAKQERHMTAKKGSAVSATKKDGTAKSATPTADESPAQARQRETTQRREKFQSEAKAMTLEELAEELPVGSEIRVEREGVSIRAAIAGGGVRVYGGRTIHEAMAVMREEQVHGPQLLNPDEVPSPSPAKTAEAEAEDRGTRSRAGATSSSVSGRAGATSSAKKAAAKKAPAKKAAAKKARR